MNSIVKLYIALHLDIICAIIAVWRVESAFNTHLFSWAVTLLISAYWKPTGSIAR